MIEESFEQTYLTHEEIEMIRKYPNVSILDWGFIIENKIVPEEIILEFQDKFTWYKICKYQKITEDLIRNNKDKVNWRRISIYQKLTESFISEFQNYVDWDWICERQVLSEDFIKKFINRIDLKIVLEFQTGLYSEFIKQLKSIELIRGKKKVTR
jgi:hypothetical protein